jgi:hypothetical protein
MPPYLLTKRSTQLEPTTGAGYARKGRQFSVTEDTGIREGIQKQDWKGIAARNGKGCDIGYALAASSCEEANSVDACTVTALDATTAFAVPNPG